MQPVRGNSITQWRSITILATFIALALVLVSSASQSWRIVDISAFLLKVHVQSGLFEAEMCTISGTNRQCSKPTSPFSSQFSHFMELHRVSGANDFRSATAAAVAFIILSYLITVAKILIVAFRVKSIHLFGLTMATGACYTLAVLLYVVLYNSNGHLGYGYFLCVIAAVIDFGVGTTAFVFTSEERKRGEYESLEI
eukprot:TRINITY_DN54202_c0_g1_i1.p1 TRINITY_DN54202_c0_g1~~TRINITY_DN54202_c0_g1_i1.p1  ORF type:complete len:205 (+),score=28.71 TRINITY_DN54202_c0_g1_i1:26-616(+)